MYHFSPTPPPPATPASRPPPPATTQLPPENFSGGLFPAKPKSFLTFRSTRSHISPPPTRRPISTFTPRHHRHHSRSPPPPTATVEGGGGRRAAGLGCSGFVYCSQQTRGVWLLCDSSNKGVFISGQQQGCLFHGHPSKEEGGGVAAVQQQGDACLAADGNTFLELRDNIQGYVAAAAVNYNQGNSDYHPL
nr:hypothetical protein [Tanacetum cinerariifolium]